MVLGRASLMLSNVGLCSLPSQFLWSTSVSFSGSPTGAPPAGETQRTIPVFKELTVWFGETGGYVCGPGTETVDVRCRCKLGNGSLGWSQGWFLVDWGSEAGEGMGE